MALCTAGSEYYPIGSILLSLPTALQTFLLLLLLIFPFLFISLPTSLPHVFLLCISVTSWPNEIPSVQSL